MSSKPDPNIPFGPKQRPWIKQLPPEALDAQGQPLVTPPSADPVVAYGESSAAYPFEEERLKERYVEVPPVGLTALQKHAAVGKIRDYLKPQHKNFLGYQVIEQQRYSALKPYLNMFLNNIGDPFVDGNFTVNVKPAERAVMDFFASLWHADWPSQMGVGDSYWGYVLSMGSTEGNLYATLNARDYLSGCTLEPDPAPAGGRPKGYSLIRPNASAGNPNAFTPLAFYSEDTHYSVMKAVHAMNMKTFYQEGMEKYPNDCPLDGYKGTGKWPEMVPSRSPDAEYPIGEGAVDINALATLVEFFASKGYPPFIVLNYGTTFKGAYDDVAKAGEVLMPILKKYGLDQRCLGYKKSKGKNTSECADLRTGYWIHLDGALGASFMPFVEMLHLKGELRESGPQFDFRLPFVQSMVTSGHKWPGAPAPTGIYMSKRKYLVQPPDTPSYLGAPDTTFAGSRNGLSAMALWELVTTNGYPGFFQRALRTLALADYAYAKLDKLAKKLNKGKHPLDIWLQRSPLSLAIIFRKPRDEIMFKYSLCVADADQAYQDGKVVPVKRTYVHMFCMWGRSEKMFDELVRDLSKPGAFDKESESPCECMLPETPKGGRRLLRVPRAGGMS